MVEHDDLVGIHDGGEPVRDDQRRATLRNAIELRLDGKLGTRFQRRGGLVEDDDRRVFRKARAIEMRCFSPPESLSPRSPTIVSYCCGKAAMNPSSCAARAASAASPSEAPARP